MKEIGKICSSIIPQLSGTFSDSVIKLMELSGITVDKLSETSQLSRETIKRLRNDRNYCPSYKTLVALCIGLKLPPPLSKEILNRACIKSKIGNYNEACYETLLNTAWNKSIYEVNEILEQAGIPPLTQ